MKLTEITVVAEAHMPDGEVKFVAASLRERDLEPDVLTYLREQAAGMHSNEEQVEEFENDSLGG